MPAARTRERCCSLAADAGECRRGKDAFGRPAGPHIDIDAGLERLGHVDDAGNVAVADQPQRRAGFPHLLD
jgi:hypothetical protein